MTATAREPGGVASHEVGGLAGPPRGVLGLLFDPLFGGLFWGKLFASAGVWMHTVVAAILVYQATGSTLAVAIVGGAQFAPQVLLAPISGTWADRGHAAQQILLGRILCTVGSGSLALWTWLSDTPTGWVEVGPTFLASLLVGLGFVVGGPAMQSIVPTLIRPGELTTAMSLNTAPLTIARMAGPVLGATVASGLGAAAAFAIAAACHLAFAVAIALLHFPDHVLGAVNEDYSVRAALRHVWSDRGLLMLLIGVAAVGIGSEPSINLAPALADRLDAGPAMVGETSASFGAGAAVGLLIVLRVRREAMMSHWSIGGLFMMATGLACAALSRSPWALFASFALVGAGFSVALTLMTTLVQSRVPAQLRGRVMALWLVAFIGSRPFASTFIGACADLLGVSAALLITAGVVAALMPLVALRPGRRPDTGT